MSRSLPILFLFTFLVIASSPEVANADALVLARVGNFITETEQTNNGPVSASASATITGASANASANLADGTLRIFSSANSNHSSVSRAEFNDQLIFSSAPGGPSTFAITFGVNVHGLNNIANVNASDLGAQVFLTLGAATAQRNYLGNGVFSDILTVTTTVNAGQQINVRGILQTVGVLSDGTVDFSNTATGFLSLPTGVTFTSQSGAFLTQPPNAIPEPTTMLLLGSGLAGIALRLRRRPKQVR